MRIAHSLIVATVASAALASAASAKPAHAPECLVPSLKGDTLAQARQKLRVAHCAVGRVTDAKTTSTLDIASQSPTAGKREKAGARVSLVLEAKKLSSTATSPVTTAAPVTTLAPLTLHVSIDPSHTQNSSNPLEVTYQISASATSGASQEASSLPAGVLEFFSDGSLADTMNVGGSTTGGSVTVTYGAYGQHTTNVVYDSGTNSTTTGNVAEDILPPPPFISGMPANIVTAATSPSGATITFAAPTTMSLTDDAISSPTCSITSGTVTAIGTVTDTCMATDQWGQTTRASFRITVTPPTTPPTVTDLPADISVPPTDPSGTVVTFTPPTATDAFGTPVAVSCSIISGTLVAVGTATDQCSATDQWGNTAIASFTITVESPAAEALAFTMFDTSTTGENGSAVPQSLTIPMSADYGPDNADGAALDLYIAASGGYTSDPFPAGVVTFTITPSPWIEEWGSTDCSAVENASPSTPAVAGCAFYFSEDGTYTITTSFTSDDPLYESISVGPAVTVDVTGS